MKLVDGLQQPVTIKSWEGAVLRPIIAADHRDAEKRTAAPMTRVASKAATR